MSTIKDLKNNPEYSVNLIDTFNLFIPKNKPKYLTLITSLIKKSIDIDKEGQSIKNRLIATYKLDPSDFENITPMEMILMYRVMMSMFSEDLLDKFKIFCEFNERGLIQKNDLTSYNTFDEIFNEVQIAELKQTEKELEQQVLKLYDDGEWLLIKPLTHLASNKYGAGTKWCTASERDQSYFNDYSKRGILIYTINRNTNYKVATYRRLNENEVSFWNVVDTRIDSIQTELPEKILLIIKNEMLNNLVTNESLLPEGYKKSKLLKSFSLPGSIKKVGRSIREELSVGMGIPSNNEISGGEMEIQVENDTIISHKVQLSGEYGSLIEKNTNVFDGE